MQDQTQPFLPFPAVEELTMLTQKVYTPENQDEMQADADRAIELSSALNTWFEQNLGKDSRMFALLKRILGADLSTNGEQVTYTAKGGSLVHTVTCDNEMAEFITLAFTLVKSLSAGALSAEWPTPRFSADPEPAPETAPTATAQTTGAPQKTEDTGGEDDAD